MGGEGFGCVENWLLREYELVYKPFIDCWCSVEVPRWVEGRWDRVYWRGRMEHKGLGDCETATEGA